ncbi:HK [Mytilus coruscus]|uniref:HK n=1 Tax=Mytilus coruscus TaxID=42192 RepID=A0A6J8DJ53_MYTCO|nr:HK [Mytilus coruscus]
MIEAKEFKTKVIESLAHKLSDFVKSDKGRKEILNPPGRKNINAVSSYSLNEKVVIRINMGINRWCEGEDVLKVIKEIECEMKNLLSDIELMIHNIEEDFTGFARSIHDVSFSVFTRSALHVNLMSNTISFVDRIRMMFKNPLVREPYQQFVKERKAQAIMMSGFYHLHMNTFEIVLKRILELNMTRWYPVSLKLKFHKNLTVLRLL